MIGKIVVEVVPLLVKCLEVFRIVDPVLNYEAQHHPPGFLGIDGDISESCSVRFFKDRCDNFVWKRTRLNGFEIFI